MIINRDDPRHPENVFPKRPDTLFMGDEEALKKMTRGPIEERRRQFLIHEYDNGGGWDRRYKSNWKIVTKALFAPLVAFIVYMLATGISLRFSYDTAMAMWLGSFISTPIVYRMYRKIKKVKTLPTSTMDKWIIIVAIGIMWLVNQFFIIAHHSVFHIDVPQPSFSQARMWSFLILSLIAAPIIEELIFRGVLLKALTTIVSPGVAIIITSIAFAQLHDVGYMYAFTLGVCFAMMAIYTGSLKYSIIAHMGVNALSAISMFYPIIPTIISYGNPAIIMGISGAINIAFIVVLTITWKRLWQLRRVNCYGYEMDDAQRHRRY